ncbi:MAG: hypothetical protein J5590_01480 [Clostridia bacterium]|nr:hypothetical protein [Clostridia bacterium]
MSEISAANGEKYEISGTEIKGVNGKTYRITGFDPDSLATKDYVDGEISALTSDDIPYDNSESSLEATNLQDAIDEMAALLPGKIETWRQIQDVVRRGLASSYYNVGDSFEVNKGQSTLIFDVAGFDQDVPITSAAAAGSGSSITGVSVNFSTFLKKTGFAGDFIFFFSGGRWRNQLGEAVNLSAYGISVTGTEAEGDSFEVSIPHTMTLKLHSTELTGDLVFDAPEATWYINTTDFPNGLAAGTYNFTIPSGYSDRGGKTYQFTLSNAVPVGGSVRYVWDSNKIVTYDTVGKASKDQEALCTEGGGGTAMPAVSEERIKRTRYGSCKWSESAIRQWLNANTANWWNPQNDFDRPANTGKAGFLEGIEPAFAGIIKPVYKTTKVGNDAVQRIEKIFLLSKSELFGTADTTEGDAYSYYGAGASDLPAPGVGADSNRVAYSGSTAKQQWTRSANDGSAISANFVMTGGEIQATYASWSLAAVPACVIY